MTDKHRHRYVHAPHGFLPNWVLVLFATAAIVLVALAQTIVGGA
jgi:hypothetical protein